MLSFALLLMASGFIQAAGYIGSSDDYLLQSNPALLAETEGARILYSGSDPYGWGDSIHDLVYMKADGKQGLAFASSGFKAMDYDYREANYKLAYSRKLKQKLSFGAAINYQRVNSLEAATGYGCDLGLLYTPRNFKIGIFAQNFGQRKWTTDTVDYFKPQWTCQLAWQPSDTMIYAINYSSDFMASLEWKPIRGVSFFLKGGKKLLQAEMTLTWRNLVANYSIKQQQLGIGERLLIGFQY